MTDTTENDVKTCGFGPALTAMKDAAAKRRDAMDRIHDAHAAREAALAEARAKGEADVPARRRKNIAPERAIVTRPGVTGSGIMLGTDVNNEPTFFSVDPNTGTLWPFELKVEDMLASDWVIL